MKITALDCETRLITETDLAPPLVSLCLNDKLYHHIEAGPAFRAAADGLLVGLNIRFDLAVLVRHDPSLAGPVWQAYADGRVIDVGVRQQLLDIASGRFREEGYSLQDLARRLLKRHVEKEDTWRLRYGELMDIPVDRWPRAAREYALEDVAVTRAIYDAQPAQVTNEAEQVRADWALYWMAIEGIAVDRARVASLEHELNTRSVSFTRRVKEQADRALAEGHTNALYRWDGPKKEPKRKLVRNDAEIRRRVRLELGIHCPRTETGLVSTSEDTLRLCVGQPDLLALADNAGTEKLRTAFLPYLRRAAELGSVHPRFNVLVSSGRTSCAKPNLQQLPREGGVRECFTARPGYVLVSCDYSGAESATLAQILLWMFGESKMADALRAGRDLHLDFAAQLLQIPYEEARARHKASDKEVKKARQFAKVFNFGAPGGLGATKLVDYARGNYGLEMSEATAKEYKRAWLKAYPEMRRYFDHVAEISDGDRQITQWISRRVRGGMGFCDTANGYFQGLAADMFKAALWRASWECYRDEQSQLFGSRLLVAVHDEIVAEVPEDRAHEAAHRLSAVMVEAARPYVPDIPIKAEPTLMRNWSKDAEPRYVGGRLVPWQAHKAA